MIYIRLRRDFVLHTMRYTLCLKNVVTLLRHSVEAQPASCFLFYANWPVAQQDDDQVDSFHANQRYNPLKKTKWTTKY